MCCMVISGVLWTGMVLMYITPSNDLSHHIHTQSISPLPFSPVIAREEKSERIYIRSSDYSFDWDDVQLAQNVTGLCGADKCFWRSTSDPISVGYLVSSAKYNYKTMRKSYEFAVNILEEKCHSRHLLLDAPKRVKVTSDFVRHLNALKHNDYSEYRNKQGKKVTKLTADHQVFDEDDHAVVVQKVRVAPKPNLLFGYMAGKWDMLVEKDIPRFRSELQADGTPLRLIEEKLESERKGIECAMQYSETYYYDLQGLIDLEGNYFHIDIDSQFWLGIIGQESENGMGRSVTRAVAYNRRHAVIGKFNDMIHRLVDPPPDGLSELSAWGESKNDGDDDDYYYY